MLEVDSATLEQRRRLGLDRWDEMWEGVLHMAPAPATEHQRILAELLFFLMGVLRRSGRGTLLAADGLRGGAPDAVIEIRSPNEESYEKLPFFAKLGVAEVIVMDRDTKRVELLRLSGGRYEPAEASADGGLTARTLGVSFHTLAGASPRLRIADAAQPSIQAEI